MSEEKNGLNANGAGTPAVPPGKIYADSINIYDDEARIAFDYLEKAARKIIAEEDRIAGLKEQSDARIAALAKRKSGNFLKAVLCAVGAAILFFGMLSLEDKRPALVVPLVPLVIGAVFFFKTKKDEKDIAGEEEVRRGLDVEFANIKRDYSISQLGVAYVPIATSVPFENRSFVLDDTETVDQQEFSLYQMNEQEDFFNTLEEIKYGESSLPLVESGTAVEDIPTGRLSESLDSVKLHDHLGELDRNLRSVSYMLNDLKKTSVSLPVIDPKSEYAAFLRDHCAEEVGDNPVLDVFAQKVYAEELMRFDELNQMRKRMAAENAKLEKMLQEFIVDISAYVQLMSRAKLSSVGKIINFSNTLMLNTFKASYNHYSGLLEKESIKRMQEENFDFKAGEAEYQPFSLSPSSRVHFDPVSCNWVSDDGGRTSHPFGIHQIQEEIIAPLVQNLLKETRTERLKIYNGIMDQKRDYLNQWHRDTDDFYGRGRAESNSIIGQMQTTLAEFNTAVSQYKSYEDTVKTMRASGGDLDATEVKASVTGTAFSISLCEQQTAQINQQQDEFHSYIERLNEDIDRRATEFGYTKFYDASLRDGHAKDVAMSILAVNELDERRKMLLDANAYIASHAQLPPEPVVDPSVYGTLGTNLNEVVSATLAGLASAESELESAQAEGAQESGEAGDETSEEPANE